MSARAWQISFELPQETRSGRVDWASMERAWAWSSANSWLIRHSDEETYGEKVRECHRLQRRIEKTTEKLVSVQAWRAFFSRLDDQTVQGLNAWMKAVGRIGKGTGKHAYRHRRAARRYAMNCVQQIPAWVMPLAQAMGNGGGQVRSVRHRHH